VAKGGTNSKRNRSVSLWGEAKAQGRESMHNGTGRRSNLKGNKRSKEKLPPKA
jgi:hypothetical protein